VKIGPRSVGKPGFPIPRPREGLALTQGDGGTRFPHPPARWEGVGGPCPHAGRWGNRVPPSLRPVGGCGRALPSRREMGEPGSPIPPPGGRVWEGLALTQGDGETGFPHPPPGGRVWEGVTLPRKTLCSFRRCVAEPHGRLRLIIAHLRERGCLEARRRPGPEKSRQSY